MKLFTKDINNKLFKQYQAGNDLDNQMVVSKIFNPYGKGRWFLLNSDPQDPDYLWAIVQMGDIVEVGSVSRSELESLRVSPYRFPLERDLGFSEVNAGQLLRGLEQGKFYKNGGTLYAASGMQVGRYYKDKNGDSYRYIGENSQGQELFNDGEKVIVKSTNDFEEEPKEKRRFGFFEDGGFVDKTDEELKSMNDDELFEYLDAKAAYMKQYAKPLSSFKAKNFAANSTAVQFQNEGTAMIDANFPSLSKINEQATKDYQETIAKKADKMDMGGYTSSLSGTPKKRTTLTMAKGDKLKELLSKAKSATKKVYAKSKDYTKKQVHDQKKKIALEVISDTKGLYKTKSAKNNLQSAENLVDLKYVKGGKVKFADKVKSIKASLLKTKKVPKKVQKDYGKTYNPKEAELAAKRIAGSMRKKGIK